MPRSNYMRIQNELNWNMRIALIHSIVDIHGMLKMFPETLFLTMNIVDRLFSKKPVAKSKLELVGLTTLFITSKHEDVLAPSVRCYTFLTKNRYKEEDITNAEIFILQILDYKLSYPNPMNFLRRNSRADNSNSKSRTLAKYLMEVTLLDYNFISCKPSMIAAASFYVARVFLNHGEWVRNEKMSFLFYFLFFFLFFFLKK